MKPALLVEPQPLYAKALRDQFPPPKFDVYQCALADRAGTLDFEINEFDATSSTLPTHRDSAD